MTTDADKPFTMTIFTGTFGPSTKGDETRLKQLAVSGLTLISKTASLTLVAVLDGRGDTQLEWKRLLKQAKTMHDACKPLSFKRTINGQHHYGGRA
jgi:hypothetical protein